MMYLWILLLIIFIAALLYYGNTNNQILNLGPKKEDPFDILKRRFAKGEITEKEYEERKAILERDEFI